MPIDPDFKRAIEEVKLRAPIEEFVRERVPELRQRGRLWDACCPFHEEKTPSFKVDPRRGTWRCYGACQRGGDVISFVQESLNLQFREALELLAGRVGVELPRTRGQRESRDDDPGLVALAAADAFFQRELEGNDARAAREYLERRGVGKNTIQAFGLGWAPSQGGALVAFARRQDGVSRSAGDLEAWERAGLLRTSDDGRPYSFFRGRLIIPIRDVKGRTVGFGARRLDDSAGGPKYINTPETPWFHKGRVIYALDRAIDDVRRGGHLVLVEGYTDVIAAHQAGLSTVCAVLGTSTTDDHAALVRRAGARRVSLLFDGDAAGRAASVRALAGLLPLDVELDVVTLPAGVDPADLVAQGGGEALASQLELAQGWFDFLVSGLAGLEPKELDREVDRVLELLGRLPKPVHRDALLGRLAERLSMPVSTLREAWRALPSNRRAGASQQRNPRDRGEGRQAGQNSGQGSGQHPGQDPGQNPPSAPRKPVDRRVLEAYKAAVGAALVDSGLIPRLRPWVERCPSPGLTGVLAALVELFEDEDATIDVSSVMTHLGEHPVRDHVGSLEEHARAADFPPHELLDQSLAFLAQYDHDAQKRHLQARIDELQHAADRGDEDAARELEDSCAQLISLCRSAAEARADSAEPSGAGAA